MLATSTAASLDLAIGAAGTTDIVTPIDTEAQILAVLSLSVSAFRNYSDARIETDVGPVVLTGPNGAGKTNLLEAISLLSPGRGLRGAGLADFASKNAAEPWAIAAQVNGLQGRVRIGTGRDPSTGDGDRRVVRIDGETARSQSVLAEQMTIVWLTPQMDRLFVDTASGRRRFLDRMVFAFDPAHAGRVSRYDRVLRERSRLLRDGSRDTAWLDALEFQIAETGVAIAAARGDLVVRLNRAVRLGLGPFPAAELRLAGPLEAALADAPALTVEDRFRETLCARRGDDAVTGGAAIGPHRSDMVVTHSQNGIEAPHCSTGEQKALLIAMTIGHCRLLAAERGCVPVLLMDEIAAHLDEKRRVALFDEFLALGAQVWLTGTDHHIFDYLKGNALYYAVADGRVTPRRDF